MADALDLGFVLNLTGHVAKVPNGVNSRSFERGAIPIIPSLQFVPQKSCKSRRRRESAVFAERVRARTRRRALSLSAFGPTLHLIAA